MAATDVGENRRPSGTEADQLRCATVFGGTGFLGRRVVAALAVGGTNVIVASRNPSDVTLQHSALGKVSVISADVTDPPSITPALEGAQAVANCVGLYMESDTLTFEAVHVEGARNVAVAAARAGLKSCIQISGIGSDADSPSPYIRARGRQEVVVRASFPGATILRPSVMFGRGDTFLSAIAGVVTKTPIIPLFGTGGTRLQPVWVDDVAQAVRHCMVLLEARGATFELGGPEILTYRQIVRQVLESTGRRRLLMPFPMGGWRLVASLARMLPSPPLTEGQVALMRQDNIVDPDLGKLSDLGITATTMSAVSRTYL